VDAIEILKQVFGLATNSVFGVATNKSPGRGVGFTFKFKQAIKIVPAKLQEFNFVIADSKFTGLIFNSQLSKLPSGSQPMVLWLQPFNTEKTLRYLNGSMTT